MNSKAQRKQVNGPTRISLDSPRAAKTSWSSVIILLALINVAPLHARSIAAKSPNDRIHLTVDVVEAEGIPTYSLTYNGTTVVESSALGLVLDDHQSLGGECRVLDIERGTSIEDFAQVTGKRSRVRVESNGLTITFHEYQSPTSIWELQIRVSNSGVAFLPYSETRESHLAEPDTRTH